MRSSLALTVVLTSVAWAPDLFAQTPCPAPAPATVSPASPLPGPTGAFKVGRAAYHVAAAPGTSSSAAAGDLMVHIWYPADAPAASDPASNRTSRPAAYLAGWEQSREKLAEPVRRLLQTAYCSFEANQVFSYAIENAPVASRERRYPLLLFAHGLGITGFAYAAQLEDLASHGYVVAAVENPGSAAFVAFPDGRVSTFDAQRWGALQKLPEDSLALTEAEKAEMNAGAQVLRLALDEIVRRDQAGPLAGRLDFQRVGAFGHSLGAMSVLRAVQLDPRFRAGLMQDALGQGVRAFAAEGGRQPRAPIALFFRPVRPGQRAELAELFNALPPGTMLATPTSPGFAHMSFSDLPLLRAGENAETRAAALRNLAIVRAMTRSFFDNALRGSGASPATLTSQGYPELAVEISAK